jgi:hypothetical protein
MDRQRKLDEDAEKMGYGGVKLGGTRGVMRFHSVWLTGNLGSRLIRGQFLPTTASAAPNETRDQSQIMQRQLQMLQLKLRDLIYNARDLVD